MLFLARALGLKAEQNIRSAKRARDDRVFCLYTRYPIVARALGIAAAFRPSAHASKGILHTSILYTHVKVNSVQNKDNQNLWS